MSANAPIQAAILAALDAASGVTALLADHPFTTGKKAILDFVPQADASEDASKFPYIVIGDDTAAEWDTDDTEGQETTITLHIWDLYRGKKNVKLIADAVHAALHDATLTVTGHTAVFCFFEMAETIPDPDPMRQHQVMRFRIATHE